MHEKLLTTIRQARLHLRRGDSVRAMELLENARALARDDHAILLEVLPDLVQCYYDTNQEELARQFEEQLHGLRGEGLSVPYGEDGIALAVSAKPRRALLTWGIVGAVVICAGIAGVAYFLHRSASSRYGALPFVDTKNVGMLVRVGNYAGEVMGRNVAVEIPLASGTCFAIHKNGLMLTLAELVTDDPARTPQMPFATYSTLVLQGTALWVYFNADEQERLRASFVGDLEGTNLAVVKVDRRFSPPLRLSEAVPEQDLAIRAIGYSDVPTELLTGGGLSGVIARLEEHLEGADTMTAGDWMDAWIFDRVESKGRIIRVDRYADRLGQMTFSGRIGPGFRGGPLLNEYGNVVGIVMSVSTSSDPTATVPNNDALSALDFANPLEVLLARL